MRYCGPVEFVVYTPEEWRAMPTEVFERTLESFTEAMRKYHADHAAYRKTHIRWAIPELLS